MRRGAGRSARRHERSPNAETLLPDAQRIDRRLLHLSGPARAALTGAVACGFVGAAAAVGQMALLAQIVERAFVGGQDVGALRWPLGALLGAIAVRAAARWGREVAAQRGAAQVQRALRERLFTHLMRLGPAYTRGERTGELVATVTDGTERLGPYVGLYLPQVALSAAVPLGIAASVLPLDVFSGLLLLLTAPVIPVLMVLVGAYAEAPINRQWLALARMSAYFLDVIQGLATLKLFGRGTAEAARVARVGEEYRVRTMRALRAAFLSGLVLEFMTAMAIALIAVELGVRLLNGQIGFGPAFFILLVAPEFYRPLRDLGMARHAGMEGKAAAARLFAVLDTGEPGSREVGSPVSSAPVCQRPDFSTLRLTGVRYTYPGAVRPALAGVTLELPAGSRTALVGPSGGGKSTLVNLLLRFMTPDAGTICASGVGAQDISLEVWRAQIALVPQRPYLFAGSVAANLRLARPAATDAEIAAAARHAGAHGFITALPQGYDTLLGERGAGVSAGQAQRLAIARAFLKDAPLLVLDEPTASLDPESEARIRVALARLMAGRTVLIVAHRLNTAIAADRIAFLDAGRIVECGTHAALLARGGRYATLVGARAVERAAVAR